MLFSELNGCDRKREEFTAPQSTTNQKSKDGVVAFAPKTIALGVQQLAAELASRDSLSSWKELLAGLRQRSLHGMEFVVSDDHAGLRRAIQETFPEAVWQRCYVHFLRNALDYLPRKADDDCLQELCWIMIGPTGVIARNRQVALRSANDFELVCSRQYSGSHGRIPGTFRRIR